MILYIEDEIKKPMDDNFDEILFKRCAVRFDIKDNVVIVYPQKITLDEFYVNELFDTFFYNNDIEYGSYGGSGCAFSLNVFSKLRKG